MACRRLDRCGHGGRVAARRLVFTLYRGGVAFIRLPVRRRDVNCCRSGSDHPPSRQPDRLAAAGKRARACPQRVGGQLRRVRAVERPGSLPGAAWACSSISRAGRRCSQRSPRLRSSFPTAGFHHPLAADRVRGDRVVRSLSAVLVSSTGLVRQAVRGCLEAAATAFTRSSSLPSPSPPLACSPVSLQRRSR